jgi:hypothetical protein
MAEKYQDDMKNHCHVLTNQNGTHIPHAPHHIIEWRYVWVDYASSNYSEFKPVVKRKFATKALCVCGQVLTIDDEGNLALLGVE